MDWELVGGTVIVLAAFVAIVVLALWGVGPESGPTVSTTTP